jgi:CubicO group peptidase (beta-lactamase class C family)
VRPSLALAALALVATPADAQDWTRALRPAGATVAGRMAHWRVKGLSVAVVDDCRIVDERGFGVADAAGTRVTSATLFQAASLSKPMAAAAALRLVEEGRLTLDGDVRGQLRSWTLPGDAPVSLRTLLGHVAGIGVASFPGYPAGAPVPTLTQVLDGIPPANTAAVRAEAAPGVWRYSGGGYEIVQALLEDAGGEGFAALAARLVLTPAGMRDSGFDQPPSPERSVRAATAFNAEGSPMRGRWRVYPELAAAGLWTTPGDLARFAIAVARSVRGDSGLLSHQSARAMMTRGPGDWGLGVALGPAGRFGHTGSNAGFTSAFVLYPEPCRGAAVMTNADNGRALIDEVLAAIGAVYGWGQAAASGATNTSSMASPNSAATRKASGSEGS